MIAIDWMLSIELKNHWISLHFTHYVGTSFTHLEPLIQLGLVSKGSAGFLNETPSTKLKGKRRPNSLKKCLTCPYTKGLFQSIGHFSVSRSPFLSVRGTAWMNPPLIKRLGDRWPCLPRLFLFDKTPMSENVWTQWVRVHSWWKTTPSKGECTFSYGYFLITIEKGYQFNESSLTHWEGTILLNEVPL